MVDVHPVPAHGTPYQWDAAEPGKGYAEKAAQWRAKLEEEGTKPRSHGGTKKNEEMPKSQNAETPKNQNVETPK